jgi:hypothetical protein
MQIGLLRARPAQPPRITFDAARSELLDRDVVDVRRKVAQRLIDRQRDSLYR